MTINKNEVLDFIFNVVDVGTVCPRSLSPFCKVTYNIRLLGHTAKQIVFERKSFIIGNITGRNPIISEI